MVDMNDRFTIDPANEMLILTTKEGKLIGEATRKECHQGEGKTHWAILAVIMRSNGNIILARRSAQKSVFPNIWDGSVATHVLAGDKPESSAIRETQEELGIFVSYKPIGSFYYFAKDEDYAENEYCTVLVGVSDEEVKPLPAEVSEVKEMSISELEEAIVSEPESYSPWFRIAFEKFKKSLL